MENNQRWKEIPTDILKLILKYDGSIVERNGIYYNQIPKNDERYEIIKKIPQKEYYKMNIVADYNCCQYETFVYFQNKKFYIGFIETPDKRTQYIFRGSMSRETHVLL